MAATFEQRLLSYYFCTHAATHKYATVLHSGHLTLSYKSYHITEKNKTNITREISIIHLLKQIMGCSSDKPKTALKVQTQKTTVN